MSGYRRRLEKDLDGWIGAGLVPAASREPMLASIAEPRRLDAVTALAAIGAVLAGAAIIAFTAANWSAIPRLVRFVMILTAFLGAAGGAAWSQGRGKPVAGQTLLAVAALIFAAAVGLTGQIFDIAGDPATALRSAGLGAVLLAIAGRSPWTAAVGLALLSFGDLADGRRFGFAQAQMGWGAVAAPLAAAAALRWRAASLAHAAGLALIVAVLGFDQMLRRENEVLFAVSALVFAGAAAGVRQVRDRFEAPADVLYGWLVWGALIWLGASGFTDGLDGAAHSVLWLAVSIGVVVLGRHDGRGLVTAAGVVSLFSAGARLLFNLGVSLLTSAAVFGLLALIALVVAFVLRRRRA